MIEVSDILKQRIIERDETETLVEKLNCIVVGKTGVGKSTLINALLGEEKSTIGQGSRGTQDLSMLLSTALPYTSEDSIFALYDTLGLELENQKLGVHSVLNKSSIDKIATAIEKKIEYHQKTRNSNEYIHCIFYCINAMGDRIEDVEIDFMKRIAKTGVQVFPILTKVQDEHSIYNLRQKFQKQTGFEPILIRAIDIILEGEAIDNPFSIQYMIDFMEENMAGIVYNVNKNMRLKNWKEDKKQALKYFSAETKNIDTMSFFSALKKANKYLGLQNDSEELALLEEKFYSPQTFESNNIDEHHAEVNQLKSSVKKGLSGTIGDINFGNVKKGLKKITKKSSSTNKVPKGSVKFNKALTAPFIDAGVAIGVDIVSNVASDVKDKILETKHIRDEFKNSGLNYLNQIERIQKEIDEEDERWQEN
ncbi:GTPase [Lactococcus formosensis subsp. bovis]|jgi:Predicted GTPases|uniref:GTPase n=1 Tax=Lactococcus formosensis TaxID=1281486 RepID=UPI001BCCD51E|nr:GTPase [Lactococcus formosensis]